MWDHWASRLTCVPWGNWPVLKGSVDHNVPHRAMGKPMRLLGMDGKALLGWLYMCLCWHIYACAHAEREMGKRYIT